MELDATTLRLDLRTLLELADVVRRFPGVDVVGRSPSLFNPYISGLEVTQAIQYHEAARHLTDPADRGPDNSVRLAAKKPCWVRVYLRSGLLGKSVNVTGEMVVERSIGPRLSVGGVLNMWAPVVTITPFAGSSVATQDNPAYVTERGTLGSTLNFMINAADFWGTLRLTVRIWQLVDAAKTVLNSYQETVDATMLQTLRLRGIMIAYDGPDPTVNPPVANVKLAAPTLANLQSTAAWTLTTNPVQSQGVFSIGGNMNWFAPLTGPATVPGGCSSEWTALNFWVSLMKKNDGNRTDVIYYGLLPAATPIQNVGGCETYGVSAGPDTVQVAMAHEVGHGCGLSHGPCKTGLTDPNYPAYEPYDAPNTPTAFIGEYGLDITNGTIHPPTDKDYMSYCSPQWISLYHHAKLCFNDRFDPVRLDGNRFRPPDLVDPYLWPWEYIPDPPSWEQNPGNVRVRAESLISILGSINQDRALEVQSVMRLTALRGPAQRQTAWTAELVGISGEIVASAPVVELQSNGCGKCSGCNGGNGGGGPALFEALIPDTEPGREIRIVKRSCEDGSETQIVWSRKAPSRKPRIARFTVKVDQDRALAAWQATGSAECKLEFSLQFSKDRGRSWNGLTVGVTGEAYAFPVSMVPSGSILFRLLAHDGFYTATALSRPVTLASRPPEVSVLSPRDGSVQIAEMPLRLWAAGTASDGIPVGSDSGTWLLDGKKVAVGLDDYILAPTAGDHRCTFVWNGAGGRAQASVRFRTVNAADAYNLPPAVPEASKTSRRTRPARRRKR